MHTIRLYQQGSLLDLFINMSPVEAELKYQELSLQSESKQNQVVNEEPLIIHEFQIEQSGHLRLILETIEPEQQSSLDQLPSSEQLTSAEQQQLNDIKNLLGKALKTYNKAS